ncbi:MAG: response regulator transcription factor [Deltaproteobacteria bacterium]|nr:response regulator transcription factor [Deltaproteobacteria bacterium]
MSQGKRGRTSLNADDAPVRVLLVDDREEEVRRSLNRTLARAKGINVIGQAADGVEAIDAAVRLNPDLVLMDVAMPRMNGIEATREIRKRLPWVKVIAMSGFSDKELVDAMLEAGADGYLCKTCSLHEIEAAIHHVAEGGCWLGDEASAVMVAGKRSTPPAPGPLTPEGDGQRRNLSPRERDVLRLLADGKGIKEVAAELSMTSSGVYSTKCRMMRRLGVERDADLVKLAVRLGLSQL